MEYTVVIQQPQEVFFSFVYFEVYIDQFFAEQFLYGYLLLYLTMRILGEKRPAPKIGLAGILFAVLQCAYLFTGSRWLSAAGLFLGAAAAFSRGRRLRGIFFLFFVTLCFGGTLQALLSLFPVSAEAAGLAAFFLLSFLWKKLDACHRLQKQEVRVSLFWEDKSLALRALVDTGNRLREPLTRRPVSILDAQSAADLLGDGWEQKKGFFLIPYHSIGKSRGWMRAVTLDKICIDTSDGKSEIRKPLFAISNERISRSDDYQVILNPEHIKI